VFLPSRFHETFGLFPIYEEAKGMPKWQVRFRKHGRLFMLRQEVSQLARRKPSLQSLQLRGTVRHDYLSRAKM
jgi:hypothetical protein